MAPYTARPWPKRSWVPLGGWGAAFPRGMPLGPLPSPPPRPILPPNRIIHPGRVPPPPSPPPNRIVRTPSRVRPMPPVKNALIDPGLSTADLVLSLVGSAVIAGLIFGGIIYAGSRAAAAEPTCVALSSVGPGVGTVESKILWGGRACEGADGKWRWSHPASWDPVTVSESPPFEVDP